MGKHKERKYKKEKTPKKDKHKDRKKCKEHSPSSASSCSEDEWIEKPSTNPETSRELEDMRKERDNWLSLPANFLTVSNKAIKESSKQAKQEQKLAEQYNPATSSRELNPYWKNGTGLPSASSSNFKKPTFDDNSQFSRTHSHSVFRGASKWKKSKEPTSTSSSSKLSISDVDDVRQIQSKDFNLHRDKKLEIVEDASKKELNALAAKLVKAEILGNTALVKQLQEKLNTARRLREENPTKAKEEDVILTQTDSKGYSRPLMSKHGEKDSDTRGKKRRVDTYADGERTKYFADDDKYNLKQMFEHEKFNTAEKQNEEFLSILGKNIKNDDLDEIFTDKIRNSVNDDKEERRERDKAISQHAKATNALDNCTKCPSSEAVRKHLIVTLGATAYLSLVAHEPLTEGHCMIVPTRHTICSTQLDENEWEEIMDFRKSVTQMCARRGEDVIFFEVARYLHRFPHMHVEAVPMDREVGDLAPIYFKKAIDESEHEWATNRKLIKLEGRNVRRAVPKGLPYFFVSFGMQEGFAHVIEDEGAFPVNFAQEIIGGMLDLHHSRWRNPKRQSFQQQSDRVKEFAKVWRDFDHNCNST